MVARNQASIDEETEEDMKEYVEQVIEEVKKYR